MNPRERVLAAMRRQNPDRVPYMLALTPPMYQTFREKTGATNPSEYWDFDVRGVGFATSADVPDYSHYYPEGLPEGTTIDRMGVAHAPGSFHHFTRMHHPLTAARDVADVRDYPLPNMEVAASWGHLRDAVQGYHDDRYAVIGALEMTLFEASWYIRSMEGLFEDMLTRPEMAALLYDRITAIRVGQVRRYAQADVDILDLGDDIATQKGMLMSPRMWRRWLKPRLARVIAAAREIKPDILVWYHSDGDCRAVIPELIEIGVDILNPVQPEVMDPAELKAQYGDRLSFSGTIGTQSTMPYGTPDEVRRVVKERVETVGRGGGLFLAPTHVLEPDVPWENVVAFIEAAREYGVYR